jgi:FKBP-type peptidyl-prolyl cis-trans isomerase FkpA
MRQGFALIPLLAVTMAFLPACAQAPAEAAAGEVSLETDEQKMFYALGLGMAQNLEPFSLSEEEMAYVLAGMKDGILGAEAKVELADYQQKLQNLFQERRMAGLTQAKEAGAAYVAQAGAEPGAVKTPSGAIYIELAAGDGAQPTASDQVKLHYHGTLLDDTVFDSSVERGSPATFAVGGVVPCFKEGVMQMKVGGKAKLVCPPETAYGDRGTPGIPPGSTIRFEVELLEVITPEAPDSAPQSTP